MTEREPGVVPMLSYADGPAAMDWLADAFGFVEEERWLDGVVLAHGEMSTPWGRIMLATPTTHHVASAFTWNRARAEAGRPPRS